GRNRWLGPAREPVHTIAAAVQRLRETSPGNTVQRSGSRHRHGRSHSSRTSFYVGQPESWVYGPCVADIVPFDARRGCGEPASNRALADSPIAESVVSVHPAPFDSRTACLDSQNTAEGRAIPGKDGGFA